MNYLIETHLHTSLVSSCGRLLPEELLPVYREKGFSAIAVSDHFNRATVDYAGINLLDKKGAARAFFGGYDRMKQLGEEMGMTVYLATELRFDGSDNDYLLFGFDPSLLYDPDAVMKEGLVSFYRRCRQEGALLVHAHPFRHHCTPVDPEYLDGVEVMNMNPRHRNNNPLAQAYAERYGLIQLAGSDCHQPGDEALAGIRSDTLPRDTFELAALIRSCAYSLYTAPGNSVK